MQGRSLKVAEPPVDGLRARLDRQPVDPSRRSGDQGSYDRAARYVLLRSLHLHVLLAMLSERGINGEPNSINQAHSLVLLLSSPGVGVESLWAVSCSVATLPSRFATRELPPRLVSSAMVESVPSALSAPRLSSNDIHLRRSCHVSHRWWWLGCPERSRASSLSGSVPRIFSSRTAS